jgi:hypothetical protein
LVFLSLLGFADAGRAEGDVDPFLSCSAEFHARAEYNRSLQKTNSGHQKFLMDRANLLLRLAEARAPLSVIGCGDDAGPALNLVLCFGPRSLYTEQKSLMLDRLTELVAENGPDDPLPVCIEDEDCSACLRILDNVPSLNARP